MWRLAFLLPLGLIAGTIKIITVLLGFIVIPIATLSRAYSMTEARPPGHPKHYDGDKYNWTWKWMKPWDNWSDGIANRNYKQFDSMFMQIMYWSAFRNPANGLREMPITSVKIKPIKIDYKGSLGRHSVEENTFKFPNYKGRFAHWYVCWHGIYSCVFWQFHLFGKLRRLWIGYKLKPQDRAGLDQDDYRIKGAAFTVQFKQIHER